MLQKPIEPGSEKNENVTLAPFGWRADSLLGRSLSLPPYDLVEIDLDEQPFRFRDRPLFPSAVYRRLDRDLPAFMLDHLRLADEEVTDQCRSPKIDLHPGDNRYYALPGDGMVHHLIEQDAGDPAVHQTGMAGMFGLDGELDV